MERRGFSPNGQESPSPRPENRVSDEHQVILRRWQELVYEGQPDVAGRLRQFHQETQEVVDEVIGETEESVNQLPVERRESLGGEVVDTIIAGLGLLDTLGLDFETMFYKKVGIMYEKYNPAEIYGLMGEGMTHKEAMAHLKARWNNNGNQNGS